VARTAASVGDSGNISFKAHEILVGAGAAVLAHASSDPGPGFASGDVTLEATALEDVQFVLNFDGFQLVGAEAAIEVGEDALITGRDVRATTSATTHKLATLDDALAAII